MEPVVVAKTLDAAVIAAALVAASGCDGVLGLTAPVPADARTSFPNCVPGDDKDGDGIDDCFDNCPGIANAGQEDNLEVQNGQLADGIGDACDPAPTKTGDARTRFISFVEPNERLEWHVNTGSWVIASGAYVYTRDNASNVESTSFLSLRPAPPFAIQLGVELTDISAATIETLGITLDGGANQRCEIYTGMQEELNVFNQNGGTSFVPPSGSFVQGVALTLRGDVRGTTVSCSIDNIIAGMLSIAPTTPPDGTLELYAKLGGFRVTYVELYDLSGEPSP
jgi:hypothetical protein